MANRRITCLITGKSYTYSQDYYNKKVTDYIDEANLKKYFITQKAKTYLNKGYSIQEIRNILNVNEESLPAADSEQVVELIEFHKIQASQTAKKISNTLNFATHKSDPEVTHFINNIRDYEQRH
jgi:DNA-binding transcriptional MerR regulator